MYRRWCPKKNGAPFGPLVWASRLGTFPAAAGTIVNVSFHAFWVFKFRMIPTSGNRRISLPNSNEVPSCPANFRSFVFHNAFHGHRTASRILPPTLGPQASFAVGAAGPHRNHHHPKIKQSKILKGKTGKIGHRWALRSGGAPV